MCDESGTKCFRVGDIRCGVCDCADHQWRAIHGHGPLLRAVRDAGNAEHDAAPVDHAHIRGLRDAGECDRTWTGGVKRDIKWCLVRHGEDVARCAEAEGLEIDRSSIRAAVEEGDIVE